MVKQFIKENIIVFVYVLFAVMLELTAQFFVDAKPYIVEFWLSLLLMTIVVMFLFSLKSLRKKRIFAAVFLVCQIAFIIASVYLYVANGSAFQKEMIDQRTDAFGTIEQFNVNIGLIVLCCVSLAAFIFVLVWNKKRAQARGLTPSSRMRKIRVVALFLSILCTATFSLMPVVSGFSEKKKEDYLYKLTSSKGDGNQMRGVTANILYELLKFSSSSSIDISGIEHVEDFIYSGTNTGSKDGINEQSDYHGISEGNNLFVILVESFDTHVLERYSAEETALLFPNVMRLKQEGVYADNFRQKEKTDTSEMLTLLGNYPTKKYVNYTYADNSFPYALPNLYKREMAAQDREAQVAYFHQNFASYYNRSEVLPNIGFDQVYGIEEMLPYGMKNMWDGAEKIGKGERSLDSLTASTMKDLMIPQGKQFFSYWTTFCMHGYYEERESLKAEGYYALLDHYGLFPAGSKEENYWRTYAASVMDFDRGLGILLKDMEDKGVLGNTTIALVSDHNTYYNSLTAYAKNLTNPLDAEGYRIPMIIYDQKLNQAMEEKGASRVIEKFTTTSDFLPTICDLLGIQTWENLCLGSTIFHKEAASIVYSRIYNIFFNDKMVFYCADDLRYTSSDFTQKDYDDFIDRAKIHLDKLYYIDKIYCGDFFKDNTYRIPVSG